MLALLNHAICAHVHALYGVLRVCLITMLVRACVFRSSKPATKVGQLTFHVEERTQVNLTPLPPSLHVLHLSFCLCVACGIQGGMCAHKKPSL